MIVHKEKIIALFKLRKTGNRGWYSGLCPFCGRNKFGVIFDSIHDGKKVSSYNCFSGKCGQKGSLYGLLKHVGRLDLINIDRTFDVSIKSLKSEIDSIEKEELNCDIKKRMKPLGWKRIYNDDYLENRGFTQQQFKKYYAGNAHLEYGLKNYVIFLIMEEGECRGWLGRSRMSSEYLEENNYPRYRNSSNTEFEKLIFGYDEIIEGVTETMILVEGITSKFNVERLLELDEQEEIKCGATFGKKISEIQIEKLKRKKIKNIILLYDPDAINESKKYANELSKYFNVRVGYIRGIGKDPGNISGSELSKILVNLENPFNFSISKILVKEVR